MKEEDTQFNFTEGYDNTQFLSMSYAVKTLLKNIEEISRAGHQIQPILIDELYSSFEFSFLKEWCKKQEEKECSNED